MKQNKLFLPALLVIVAILAYSQLRSASQDNAAKANPTETTATPASQTCDTITSVLPLEGKPEQILKRSSYTVSYNSSTLIPNYVTWTLHAGDDNGPAERPSNNAWHEDKELTLPRPTNADYAKSGWDRGHMCPAGDRKYSQDALYETFMFANACPQNHRLNSSDWNEIELACRRWANKFGALRIVSGPILFKKKHATIGANKVVVPEAFFKVVLCLGDSPKGIGFVCRNEAEGNHTKDYYVHSIADVERITGYTFFPYLPSDIKDNVKGRANIEDWE
ncbi:MAG: DNA/RNA non-specific endonuclease [Bacteroidaceae bacterium]|nr:DNA/RNA non-specific endonuclease [Bacteroidaceae bacterium]